MRATRVETTGSRTLTYSFSFFVLSLFDPSVSLLLMPYMVTSFDGRLENQALSQVVAKRVKRKERKG